MISDRRARGAQSPELDARGLKETEIVEGAERSTLDALTQLSVAADKVIVF